MNGVRKMTVTNMSCEDMVLLRGKRAIKCDRGTKIDKDFSVRSLDTSIVRK